MRQFYNSAFGVNLNLSNIEQICLGVERDRRRCAIGYPWGIFYLASIVVVRRNLMNGLKIAESLRASLEKTRVFMSMPYLEGITPRCMSDSRVRHLVSDTGIERRDGIFRLDEASLSPFDHGNLYGDAVFEGIRIDSRRVLLLREHIDRWLKSAERIGLESPYGREELCRIILELCRESLGKDGTRGYLRPVMTRGIGNLGVNPWKCIAPTVYIACSSIALYPDECYEEGIDIAIARRIRRNDARHLDPNIKTNNYLNNVLALLETRETGAKETLMLTNDGYVAEATADNIFVAEEVGGRRILRCPASRYALVGLTRATILASARGIGFEVVEDDAMLPTDFIGAEREVFITGTACGLLPVRSVDGHKTATERPLLALLRAEMLRRHASVGYAIDVEATDDEVSAYMSEATPLD